jgi:type VI secretion system protein VasD
MRLNDYLINFKALDTKAISKKIITAFTLILFLSLTGCAIFENKGPSAHVNISSAEYLNPNINGQAAPIVVTIYQLKSPYIFNQANYHELADNSAKVLANDLIDKTTIEVRPNECKSISIPLSPNTQDIGIMAAYRDIENSTWHTTEEIDGQKKGKTKIYIALESRALTATSSNETTKLWGMF